jgi:hypothetical protein
MMRRIVSMAAVAAFGLSVIGVSAASASPPIAGVGTTGSCTVVGKAKISRRWSSAAQRRV